MKTKIKVWVVLCIVGIPIILLWFKSIIPTPVEHRNAVITAYRNLSFEGVVVEKFRDIDEHNFKKVILREDNASKTVLFNNETSGIYDFIEVGDSIIKEEGSLRIRLFRDSQDTVLVMRYSDAQK